jgi:O-antigen chain-terminating methyltransferase
MQKPKVRELSVEELMARVQEEVARGRRHGPDSAGSPALAMAAPAGGAAASAPPQAVNGRAPHLRNLLNLHDHEFVAQAYRTVLGREPDLGGMDYYLRLLRDGRSKVEIIGRLRLSREGRRRGVRVRGLLLPLAFHTAYRIPVLGYALRLPVALLRLPRILRNASQFEHHVMAQLMDLRGTVSALESHNSQLLSGQAAELAQVRAMTEAQASEFQRRIDQETATLRAAHDDRASRLQADLLTLSGQQEQAQAEQAAELAQVRAALEERAGDLQGRLEHQTTALRAELTQAVVAASQRGDEGLSTLRATLEERASQFQEVSGQVVALESRQSQALSGQAAELVRVRGALEEFHASIQQTAAASDALTSRVDELHRHKVDSGALTELAGRFEQSHSNLARLKRDVLLQERRLGLLLEEARKRLPEPFDQRQLEVFAGEARHRLDAMYVHFEDEFRGTREDIKGRLQVYLPILADCGAGPPERPVMDIGCGRGEWLELLTANGLSAKGLDLNRIMIDECRRMGLDVEEAEALTHLRALPDGSLGALTGFHIIEHLPFDQVVALFDEALRVLAPGGVVIFETPNPANLQVAAQYFYIDPTHRNPLPSQTVSFMAEARGFCRVKVLPLHPMPEFEADRPDRTAIDATLNKLLFGPQDFSVIGYRP